MTEVKFYHLQKTSIYEALPQIVGKAYSTGKNIIIRMIDDASIARIDDDLWSFSPISFIPHGTKNDKKPEKHPVYITDGDENPNEAKILFLTSSIKEKNPENFDMICEVFNGNDEIELKNARSRWKEYKDKGFDLAYWQQTDTGSWLKNI